jgi:hypothetical protein
MVLGPRLHPELGIQDNCIGELLSQKVSHHFTEKGRELQISIVIDVVDVERQQRI